MVDRGEREIVKTKIIKRGLELWRQCDLPCILKMKQGQELKHIIEMPTGSTRFIVNVDKKRKTLCIKFSLPPEKVDPYK